MINIDSQTVAAESEGDLRYALATDPNILYVYLAVNITLTAGITIDPNKAWVVIDGEYPAGVFHTFTDMDSTDYYQTMGIGSSSDISITVRNLTINGHNYYGVPYVVENIWPATDTSAVSVIYENVTYRGPQLVYNREGYVRFTDCDITIEATGVAQPQEVAEVNRIEFGGTNVIRHNSNQGTESVFWFRGAAATMRFTVLEGANVTIASQNYDFMYNNDLLSIAYPVPFEIRAGARLDLTVNTGFSRSSAHPVSSFSVGQNAAFRYVQTAANGNNASLYINGTFSAGTGSDVYMQAANNSQPIIYFTNGTGRNLTAGNPHSFVLYSANARAVSTAGTPSFSLSGGQINVWTTPVTPVTAAGGLDDTPQFKWFKNRYASSVIINGTFNATTTSGTGNLVTEDEPYPAVSNLSFATARVISVGDWPFTVDTVVDDGRPITGTTDPGANMRAAYTDGAGYVVNGVAGADGGYSLPTQSGITAGTSVTVSANIPFLIKSTAVTVIVVGEITIVSAPDTIYYTFSPVRFNPPILRRADEVPVIIRDNRADVSQWQLYASITGPLTSGDGDILPDAMVYIASAGAEPVTLTETPVLVYTGGPSVVTTEVTWPQAEGILARITVPVRSGVRYSTTIIWTLTAP